MAPGASSRRQSPDLEYPTVAASRGPRGHVVGMEQSLHLSDIRLKLEVRLPPPWTKAVVDQDQLWVPHRQALRDRRPLRIERILGENRTHRAEIGGDEREMPVIVVRAESGIGD